MIPELEIATESSDKLVIISHSAGQTEHLGARLAEMLEAGDVVSLDGDLGAGKTALTRGIARGLNCKVPVSSPTFTLLIEHPAVLPGLALYHFDVYRLAGEDDFYNAGLDEYFDMGGVCVVEWGTLIAEALPRRTLQIRLWQTGPDTDPDQRRIELTWPAQPDRLNRLSQLLQL